MSRAAERYRTERIRRPPGMLRTRMHLYDGRTQASTVTRMCISVRNSLALFRSSMAECDLLRADRMLRLLDQDCVVLALTVPRNALEAAAKDAVLDRALHPAEAWHSGTARAIVTALRSLDSAPDRDPTSVYEGHEARREAARRFDERGETWSELVKYEGANPLTNEDLDCAMRIVGSVEFAQSDLLSLRNDARERAARDHLREQLALLCVTPTRNRHASLHKLRYVDHVRDNYRQWDPRVYLALDTTLDVEMVAWSG